MKLLPKIFAVVVAGVLTMPFMASALSMPSFINSVSVFNDTKNTNAESVVAEKENFLTFTLKTTNTNSVVFEGHVMSIDLSSVLGSASLVDNGGGVLAGSVLNFPATSIPANGSVSKSFKVRVKYFLPENTNPKLSAVFGNTVFVSVNQPKVLGEFIATTDPVAEFVAPRTGADTNILAGLAFATILMLAYASYQHIKALKGYGKH